MATHLAINAIRPRDRWPFASSWTASRKARMPSAFIADHFGHRHRRLRAQRPKASPTGTDGVGFSHRCLHRSHRSYRRQLSMPRAYCADASHIQRPSLGECHRSLQSGGRIPSTAGPVLYRSDARPPHVRLPPLSPSVASRSTTGAVGSASVSGQMNRISLPLLSSSAPLSASRSVQHPLIAAPSASPIRWAHPEVARIELKRRS